RPFKSYQLPASRKKAGFNSPPHIRLSLEPQYRGSHDQRYPIVRRCIHDCATGCCRLDRNSCSRWSNSLLSASTSVISLRGSFSSMIFCTALSMCSRPCGHLFSLLVSPGRYMHMPCQLKNVWDRLRRDSHPENSSSVCWQIIPTPWPVELPEKLLRSAPGRKDLRTRIQGDLNAASTADG